MNRLLKSAALVVWLGPTAALAESAGEAAEREISSNSTKVAVGSSENPVPASELPPIQDNECVPFGERDVIRAGYPRVIYFRSPTERAGLSGSEFEDYEYWKRTMLNLNGFVGKGLDEENLRFNTARPFYMRFKKEQPQKLALVHINGNARSPNFALSEFAPYFFSHFVGTKGGSEIRPDEQLSTIQVENTEAFRVKIGRGLTANDDITICRLGTDGKPDWSYYEEVKLQSINPEHSTITVRRGCFGTEPKAFESCNSYLAAHLFEGLFAEKDQVLWYYNYSLASPTDGKGRHLSDVLAEDIGRHFIQGGSCEALDGMEFDVLHDSRWDKGDTRLGYDFDHDGVADQGYHRDPETGLSSYTLGVYRFLTKLREIVGDQKLILADGHGANAQQAYGPLNGIESEGWPIVFDPDIEQWSKGMNVNLFWSENAKRPHFSYIKLRDHLRQQVQAKDGSWQRDHRDPPNIPSMVSDTRPFTAVFYYKDLQGQTIDFSAEAPGDEFRVREITVHAYPDVCLREFERGVVIANPATHPVTLNLKKLLPGRKLKRLKGTQFPAVNSGQPVGNTVEIPGQDAVFLIHAE